MKFCCALFSLIVCMFWAGNNKKGSSDMFTLCVRWCLFLNSLQCDLCRWLILWLLRYLFDWVKEWYCKLCASHVHMAQNIDIQVACAWWPSCSICMHTQWQTVGKWNRASLWSWTNHVKCVKTRSSNQTFLWTGQATAVTWDPGGIYSMNIRQQIERAQWVFHPQHWLYRK